MTIFAEIDYRKLTIQLNHRSGSRQVPVDEEQKLWKSHPGLSDNGDLCDGGQVRFTPED